jgi:hypothetical protein
VVQPRPRKSGRTPEQVFTPTRSVLPEMWIDRTRGAPVEPHDLDDGDVQTRLRRSLTEVGKQLVVYGETGVGKTSLVEHACRALNSRSVTVQCGNDLESILREALAKAGIAEESFEEIERTSGRAGLKASLGFLFAGWQREDIDTKRRTSYPVSIETTTRLALDAAGVRVLFLDTLENADAGDPAGGEVRAGISRLLKSFASEGNVKVVAAGIPAHAEPLLPLDSAAARRVAEIVVPRMADDTLTEIVLAGARLLALPFDDECVRAIVRVSQGLPSRTHEFALDAARAAQSQNAERVRMVHLEGLIPTQQLATPLAGDGADLAPRFAVPRVTDTSERQVHAPPFNEPLSVAGLRPSGWIIREILDPQFLSRQLQAVEEGVRRTDQQTALSSANYRAAYMQLEGTKPLETLYMPRDPLLSLVQSVLTFALSSRASELLGPPPDDQANIAHAVVTVPDVLTEFGPSSPHWIDQKLAECLSMLDDRRRLPPPSAPAEAVDLAPDARLIMVSDWATALPSAIAVARAMRRAIDDARRDRREVHVVHLGDAYYSGWSEEYEDRFLPYWPVNDSEDGIASWALAGNHDLYSAGHGYFGRLLRDDRFKQQQRSSWFSIEGADWQVLGLDSSYLDENLTELQVAWVSQHMEGRRRRTVLLSHHPPLHAASQSVNRIADAVPGSRVDAWFWGHDHRCEMHGSSSVFSFGSCVGHGGVPELYRHNVPSSRDGWAEWLPSSAQTVEWTFVKTRKTRQLLRPLRGFAIVDFDGPRALVEYVNEVGEPEMSVSI